MELTKAQKKALRLLARGGARYGTQISTMKELQAMGLCYAHNNGPKPKGTPFSRVYPNRWTWRPTEAGWLLINQEVSNAREANANNAEFRKNPK